MLTNKEKSDLLDNIEEAWREVRLAIRKLSDIYEVEYDTMYTAVQQAVNKVVDIDKLTER